MNPKQIVKTLYCHKNGHKSCRNIECGCDCHYVADPPRDVSMLRKLGIVPRIFCEPCKHLYDVDMTYCKICNHTLRSDPHRNNNRKVEWKHSMANLASQMLERKSKERKERLKRERESRLLDVTGYSDYHSNQNALYAKLIEVLEKTDKKSVKFGKLEIRI